MPLLLVVGFSHRSVFPIMFDGNAIESWWKSALIFKVYYRKAGQKVVRYICTNVKIETF